MHKQKNNQYGSFAINNNSRKKIYITGLVIIFIFGSVLIYKNTNNDKAVSSASVNIDNQEILPDWWLRQYFGNGVCEDEKYCGPNADPDNDKLTNAQEFFYKSHPLNPDTNKNGMTDGEMVSQGYDPSQKGMVTFEEAGTDEYILGESLVFNHDIIKMVGEMSEIHNAPEPAINEAQIKISNNNNRESILNYLNSSNAIVAKNFPFEIESYIQQVMSMQSSAASDAVLTAATNARIELSALEVPSDAVTIHKQTLGMLHLLPLMVVVPDEGALNDASNVAANRWYDSVRSFFNLMQKMEIETLKLQNKYE